jgi:hypothetical protein
MFKEFARGKERCSRYVHAGSYRWLVRSKAFVEVAHALKHVDGIGERAEGQQQMSENLTEGRGREGEGSDLAITIIDMDSISAHD